MDRRRLQPADLMTKTVRRREKPRERWLLTRKTWKYMADAGRRLVPDGAQNRPEDIPRIEAYFQEVCSREPRFLLWRKSSYPGAIPRPRRKNRARGGSVRARSPSDTPPPPRALDLHTSGGRFDIAKLRREFFAAPPPAPAPVPPPPEEDEESTLVDLLRTYLKVEEEKGIVRPTESGELTRALGRYLSRQADRTPEAGGAGARPLLDALSRYYGHAANRDHIVQDLLTDRGLLKRLYHDLRKTKPYRGGRSGGGPSGYGGGSSAFASGSRGGLVSRSRPGFPSRVYDRDDVRSPPLSPPPLIEVLGESQEDKFADCGTQTTPLSDEVLIDLERAYREKLEAETTPTSPMSPPPERKGARRRSSVDHDDVSQSVSDTIKRYLRMARKKSVDSDKADRFKRINYDKNLRNIKPRTTGVFDDDGLSKGSQTEEDWIITYREGQLFSSPSSPPSPLSPTQPQSFLSSLLGRASPAVSPAGGMQKSRSSSSVVQSVSKRLWKTRSRSSSRAAAAWTPKGSCVWADGSGRCVRLTDTSILTLTEVERRALQQAALARLHQLNLGVTIKIPEDSAPATTSKPKRRAPLLKRKALTTSFFDQRTEKGDKDKDSTSTTSVFGMPLAQCVDAERALRREQLGSRTSLSSLPATEKDDSESCDSGEWSWSRLDEAGGGGPRVPALVSACLTHLRRHGLHTLGLFRVSASKKRVRQLREEWESGAGGALEGAACAHDVAALLKEFLRALPDPLLTRALYPAFLHTQRIRNRRIQWEGLQLVVQLLPASHRDTLSALLSFLSELAEHAGEASEAGEARDDAARAGNKMDAANLATVFAPNILHRNKPNDDPSTEQLSERADVINVVRTLIERQGELWTLQAELLHEAYIHLAHTTPHHLDALLLRRSECTSDRLSNSGSVLSTAITHSPSSPGLTSLTSARERGDREGRGDKVWSREEFLHGGAATGGPDPDNSGNATHRRPEKPYVRTRRPKDGTSEASSGSLSSAMTIVTRVRSSVEESGVARTDSQPDCSDSASDYNEVHHGTASHAFGNSDSDSCVITASLHIGCPRPAPAPPAAPPRRRSTSGSSSSKRDSAVGSSASSPPSSPPPRQPAPPQRQDIDRLVSLARERNTSDARAVILRQHDENANKTRERSRADQNRTEHTRTDQNRTEHTRTDQNRPEHTRTDQTRTERPELVTVVTKQSDRSSKRERQETTLYKRGELISSARSPPP